MTVPNATEVIAHLIKRRRDDISVRPPRRGHTGIKSGQQAILNPLVLQGTVEQ